MKEWVKAEQELDGALSEISTDSELWQARGYARFQQSNQGKDRDKLKQAISDYQQALKANQDNGLARAQLAVAFVLSRQFKEAVACYDKQWNATRRTQNCCSSVHKLSCSRTTADSTGLTRTA